MAVLVPCCSVRLHGGQSVVLTVESVQLVNFIGPEFMKRGFGQCPYDLFFAISIHRNPCSSRFHTYCVVINDTFINQIINISAMTGNQIFKLLANLEMNSDLIFSHRYTLTV